MILAIVNEWVVTQVVTIEDSQYQEYASDCQIAIQIDGMYPQPQVGWTFTGNSLVPPPNYTPSMKITRLALQNRFTDSENIAILAYMDNISAAYRYPIKMLMNKLNVSTYIDLQRSDTISGVNLLMAAGLITPARANVILTTIPTAIEAYQG